MHEFEIACLDLNTDMTKNEIETQVNGRINLLYGNSVKFTYDFGKVRMPSQVLLKVEGIKKLIIISNPPIRMVHMLKNKCKKAEIGYENKRIPLMFFIPSIVMLPFFLLGKLFS